MVGTSDTKTRKYIRVDCKCWDCAYCGPRKARKYKRAIRELAEAQNLNRVVTLTLDPRSMDRHDPVAYINKAFPKFRTCLKRKFQVSITYIRVLEFQQNGNPHFHVLVDRFIPAAWVKKTWQAVGGGRIVDIRFVDIHRISRYLSKYLTKELLLSAPKRSRRVRCRMRQRHLYVRLSALMLCSRMKDGASEYAHKVVDHAVAYVDGRKATFNQVWKQFPHEAIYADAGWDGPLFQMRARPIPGCSMIR